MNIKKCDLCKKVFEKQGDIDRFETLQLADKNQNIEFFEICGNCSGLLSVKKQKLKVYCENEIEKYKKFLSKDA
jgi:hypothetical protein